MAFLSGVRALQVFGWILVICFFLAASIAGSQDLKLQVVPQVVSECGKKVTLTCNASSLRKMDVKLFSWIFAKKTVCQYGENKSDAEAVCESTADASHHRLTLTLVNVMPVHAGKYLCKLQSLMGPKNDFTLVTLEDCLEGEGSLINGSHAKCWFTGVYPNSTVHWFHGDVNLTGSASTEGEGDQHGRFNVSSHIHVQTTNASPTYYCSLWIPSKGKYLSRRQLIMPRKVSVGSRVRLQWLCGMVWIVYFLGFS